MILLVFNLKVREGVLFSITLRSCLWQKCSAGMLWLNIKVIRGVEKKKVVYGRSSAK